MGAHDRRGSGTPREVPWGLAHNISKNMKTMLFDIKIMLFDGPMEIEQYFQVWFHIDFIVYDIIVW